MYRECIQSRLIYTFFSRILFVRNHFAKMHKALKKIARGLMVTKTASFDTDNSTH